jgi:uncharacterized metal-binding protein YceD (DUF177 family)
MSKTPSPPPWSVPLAVQDVPPEGQQFELVADARVRAAVAKLAGISGVERLQANISVLPRESGNLHVTGRVAAMLDQTCVVTLEPMQSEIDEAIDLLFVPDAPTGERTSEGGEEENGTLGDERIEVVGNGIIDLGAIATEFLILAIDPYPRKPGVVFAAPAADEPPSSPFAALAALKKGPSEGRG